MIGTINFGLDLEQVPGIADMGAKVFSHRGEGLEEVGEYPLLGLNEGVLVIDDIEGGFTGIYIDDNLKDYGINFSFPLTKDLAESSMHFPLFVYLPLRVRQFY